MIRRLTILLVAFAVLTPLASAQTAPPQRPMRMPMPPPHGANAKASASPAPTSSSSAGPGASPAAAGGTSFDVGVWTVHADSVDANFKTGTFSTPDKVVMTRVGGDITADRADGNYKKQVFNLYGHVVMHDTEGNYGGLSSAGHSQSSGPSTLTADKAQIDGKGKVYTATGNVHYVQADTNVTSDQGTLNDTTHDLHLQGNVHVAQGQRNLAAGDVVYNTISGVAHAQNDVTMQFPSELHQTLATPKPIHVPKNKLVTPVNAPPATPPPGQTVTPPPVPAPAASP
jgi:lipopolysaccharide export system protein LptA